jgi:hypothetical protein
VAGKGSGEKDPGNAPHLSDASIKSLAMPATRQVCQCDLIDKCVLVTFTK